jgi:ActR/RegA family two-component response regulator
VTRGPRSSWRRQIELALASLGETDRSAIRLDNIVDQHLRRVLDACDGNRSIAARLLGINRKTLARKLSTRRRRGQR